MATGSTSHIACYRILRKLGEGGMGAVFEAEHVTISRRVAIKVLHSKFAADKSTLIRFFNEARSVNLIDHPGIVQVLDYGHREDGSSYFVMELLKGETLSARLRRAKSGLPLPKVLSMGRQIAAALAAAHNKGIVHRDVKLDNVMLVPDAEAAGGERIKILDFGIAKLAPASDVDGVRTSTHLIFGTPAYMAPEQCRGAGQVDDRADVYSLGIVLYELLVGRRPFLGSSSGELMGQHLFMEPPALAQVLPGVPAALDGLVAKLLCKDREQRPRMAEVARQLADLGELYTSAQRPGGEGSPSASQGTQVLQEADIEVLGPEDLKPRAQSLTPLPSCYHSKEFTVPGTPRRVQRWLSALGILGAAGVMGVLLIALYAQRPPDAATRGMVAHAAASAIEYKAPPKVGSGSSLTSSAVVPVAAPEADQPALKTSSRSPLHAAELHGKQTPVASAHKDAQSRRKAKATANPGAGTRTKKPGVPATGPSSAHPEIRGAPNEILED